TPSRGFLGTPTALTTSFVTVTLSAVNRLRGLGFRGILYANVDTVTRVVTVQYQGSTVWVKTIAANDTAVFDPLQLMGIASTSGSVVGEYKHKVDAITTTAVQSSIIVGL